MQTTSPLSNLPTVPSPRGASNSLFAPWGACTLTPTGGGRPKPSSRLLLFRGLLVSCSRRSWRLLLFLRSVGLGLALAQVGVSEQGGRTMARTGCIWAKHVERKCGCTQRIEPSPRVRPRPTWSWRLLLFWIHFQAARLRPSRLLLFGTDFRPRPTPPPHRRSQSAGTPGPWQARQADMFL